MKKKQKEDEKKAKDQAKNKKKDKADLYQEKIRLKNEKREAEEQAIEEEERRLEQEQQEKENQEFDDWKDLFTVETKGTMKDDMEGESGGLLNEFINFIKKNKVSPLEDIAAKFNLRTTDVVNRIKSLESSKRLTGLLDDRGKYIYITVEEMDAVAKFIQEKGRVTISDLISESNRLITLEEQSDEEDIESDNFNDTESVIVPQESAN